MKWGEKGDEVGLRWGMRQMKWEMRQDIGWDKMKRGEKGDEVG